MTSTEQPPPAKRRGRHKIPEPEQLTAQINIRLTPAHRTALQKKAEAAGEALPQHVRNVLHAYIHGLLVLSPEVRAASFDPDLVSRLTRQSRIINALAHSFNAHPEEPPDPAEVSLAIAAAGNIWRELRQTLPKNWRYEVKPWRDSMGVARNLEQMRLRYVALGLAVPPGLEQARNAFRELALHLAAFNHNRKKR